MTARGVLGTAVTRGYALAALALALYVALAPTAIVGGDNSEFAGLAVLGGRAHPSGYPLYVLWLQATRWLPGATAAHTAAIATCILAALAVLALHAACRAWGASALAATLATALFAASPIVLIIHTEAEVFALNALVMAVILWLAGAGGPLRGGRRAVALAFVAGLGLCDHVTCALVAPIGLYGAVRGVREAERGALAVGAAALGAFALGLVPYAQTALAADSPISWGATHGLGDLLHHALRADYGSTQLSPRGGDALPGANLWALARALGRAWWWLPLGVGLGTLAWRAARRGGDDEMPRGAWLALAGSWLLAGPLFIARFNIDPRGFGSHIVQRMYLLPCLLLAIPIAVGLDALGRARLRRASAAWGLAAFPLFVAPSLAPAAAEHTRAVEVSLTNTLTALPPNAAMIVDGDDFAFGIPYVQHVLGVRPDVIAISWPNLRLPWALARLAARGVEFEPSAPGPEVASVRLADQLNAAGHPVFVDDFAANVLAARPAYPYAGLMRVLPAGAAVPGVDAVFAENARAFAAFDLSYPPPGADDGFMTVAHLRYAQTWQRIAELYERAGFAAPAADARARAQALMPEE